MVEARQIEQPPRILGLPVVAWLLGVIVVCAVGGAAYVVFGNNTPPPRLPAAPPHAHELGAGQTTQMLGSGDITSVAFYRVSSPPAAVIAYYQRALPTHGGTIGRFGTIVRDGSPDAVPTALHQLPRAFVDGAGSHATARYAYTEYESGTNDVGVAVDMRHPNGPTLVFVDMLSQ